MRTPRPWTAAASRLSVPRLERYGTATGTPVLLHHGFLIGFNAIWHRSGVVGRLADGGLGVVLIAEHFLREAGDAHSFGHDAVLLLAETLADAIDDVAQQTAHIVAAEGGAAPALVTAANDDRVRRLVLADPEGLRFGPDRGNLILDEPDAPTMAELDLRIPCVHHGVRALAPAPGLRLVPEAVTAQTLILAGSRHRRAAESLAARLPRAEAIFMEDDDGPAAGDPRFAGYVSDFLVSPSGS